jgi:hypothetical protein
MFVVDAVTACSSPSSTIGEAMKRVNTPIQGENSGSRPNALPLGPPYEVAHDVRTTPLVHEGLITQSIYMAYNPNTGKQSPSSTGKKRDWILASADKATPEWLPRIVQLT